MMSVCMSKSKSIRLYGRIGYYKKVTHMQCIYCVLAKPLQSTD